jgi:two-component system sensor histidine kinase GlrK
MASLHTNDMTSARRARPWTLGAALSLSHGSLALALAITVALGTFSLRRIDHYLRELRDDELGAIDEQQTLHRAMWAVEVAMRHASDACDRGAAQSAVRPTLSDSLQTLRDKDRHVGPHVGAEMRQLGLRYESLAQRALDGDACEVLRTPAARAARNALDERLTDLWISQSFELHREIAVRESRARTTGQRSLAFAGLLTAVVVAVVAWLARWVTRSVAAPLARIARDASRLGRGDFAPIAPVDGPAEVTELADELERMRHALAALDALKEGFVASVSHELRTPLAKIREALALLEDGTAGALDAKQSSLVAIARRANETQIDLVDNLLDLSRLRAASVVKMHTEGSVLDVVREAIAAEREDAQRRAVTFELVAESASFARTMDPALLERAIANLLRNAAQVAPQGSAVRVLVRRVADAPAALFDDARARPQGVAWACVRVEDDGPGVPDAAREKLFDPFVTATTKGSGRVGVGLGLALAREVARAHGGEARLVPTPDNESGARFELWLPLELHRAQQP